MEWFKDLSPTGLMAVCLIYIVRYLGDVQSKMTARLAELSNNVAGMMAKVDECPERRGEGADRH